MSGAAVETLAGERGGRRVVAAWPGPGQANFHALLAALFVAFRPRLVIGAGFSDHARDESSAGAAVVADTVAMPGMGAFRLSVPPGVGNRLREGALATPPLSAPRDGGLVPEPADAPLAQNGWSYPFVEACDAAGLRCAVVTVIRLREATDEEAANVLRQRTAAARAGALVRAAWRRPSSLLGLARRQSTQWGEQERLADAVDAVLQAACP